MQKGQKPCSPNRRITGEKPAIQPPLNKTAPYSLAFFHRTDKLYVTKRKGNGINGRIKNGQAPQSWKALPAWVL